MTFVNHVSTTLLTLLSLSTNDEGALRNKVDEAMRVYNEYVTNAKPEDGSAPTNGAENAAPASDETADKAE